MAVPGIGGVGASGPLSAMEALAPSGGGGEVSGSGGAADGGSPFGGLLNALTTQQSGADQALVDVAVGNDNRSLADSVLAVQTESLAFELAVQIRNRLVDAYSEIFRMSV